MKDVITLFIGIAVLLNIVAFTAHGCQKIHSESRVEIHRLWTDALTRSVETICDRFLVLEVDGENMVIEVQK